MREFGLVIKFLVVLFGRDRGSIFFKGWCWGLNEILCVRSLYYVWILVDVCLFLLEWLERLFGFCGRCWEGDFGVWIFNMVFYVSFVIGVFIRLVWFRVEVIVW